MESASSSSSSKVASLRWAILRRAFLSASTNFPSEERIKCVSRRAERGFNLIFSHILEGHTFCSNNLVNLKELDEKRDAYVCYHLPGGRTPRLVLIQRLQKFLDLKNDFEVCKTNEVDNTGLVCIWPSEDVLTYFCLTHNGMFRNKRILELGSGYGLAGLAIAANSDPQEVVISDGNPQVVNCILMFAVVRYKYINTIFF
ncbi:calmodulin-lysine N-methyltransferase [Amborella trichopoda]|uniref:calmodulin-lysine N-methyltransferase n=1 Tax=Amborella trichopoda TaxID=13333 RepID=UPI0005D466EB|nr:calmodulin-lysine N-methyltransferase [Amborella trichopoda]|eukprot:XP_011626079.1 calmodulin-lysine N-methyltransferase [Amborella trichopoda]